MKKLLPHLVLAGALSGPGCAFALDFGANDFTGTLNSKLSVGAAMRTQGRNPDLIGLANGGHAYSTNGDDGDLAFHRGEFTAATAKLTSDLGLRYKGFGLFVRGTGLFNQAVNSKDNLFDIHDYGAGKESDATIADFNAKTNEVHKQVGRHFDLLDAYLYGAFPMGERSLSVKVGRQVLNWGESLLVLNGLNSLQALDANRLRVPGFEFEELTRPAAMAWASFNPWSGVSVDAFYQLEWRPTVIDVSGTFWSTNDFAGPAGTQANLGFGRANENSPAGTTCTDGSNCVPLGSTVPRGADVTPGAAGQFGGAVHLLVPFLNDMDLALYGANYHSRLPLFSGTSRSGGGLTPADTANYFVEYPKNIGLYGLSFNTTLPFDLALQGEYSLKTHQPLQIDDVELLLAGLGAAGQISPVPGATLGNQYIRGYRRFNVSQADLGLTRIIGPHFGFDQLTLLAEVGAVKVHGMPNPDVLAFDAPATYTLNSATAAKNPATAAGLPITPYSDYATRFSWGYRAVGRLAFNNVFNLVNLEPALIYFHDVNGNTPTPIVNFVEGRQQITTQLVVNYLSSWSLGLGYTTYFGAGNKNLLSDRDFADVNLKYSF